MNFSSQAPPPLAFASLPTLAEAARLENLHSFALLDTPEEPDFDDITRIASEICGTPISLITLIDEDRTWLKSHHGLELTEAPREQSLCNLAIKQPAHVLYMPDLATDTRVMANPFTCHPGRNGGATDGPLIAFYAGAVLSTPEGHKLGTLCVADFQPRTLSESQLAALQSLAKQVMRQMELRRTLRLLRETQRERDAAYSELEAFAHLIAHDLKAPLNNIVSFYDLLSLHLQPEALDEEAFASLAHIGKSALRLTDMIEAVLEYSRHTAKAGDTAETVVLEDAVEEVLSLLQKPADATVVPDLRVPALRTHRTMLVQVLLNLVSNAYRYVARPGGVLRITSEQRPDGTCCIRVEDNGPGMTPARAERVFNLFDNGYAADNLQNPDGSKRHGIGLATVKKLVTRLGGTVSVKSAEGMGTCFDVVLPQMA